MTNIVRDNHVSSRELVVFFGVTLTVSLGYVFLSGPMVEPGVGLEQAMAWYGAKAMVILWAPMLCALVIALSFRGKQGLLQLLKRLTIWKVGYKWWLAALLIPAGIHLIAALISSGAEIGVVTIFSDWAKRFPLAFLYLFIIIIGEELGWRGYALPALQARMTPFAASLLLGIIWGVWHYGVWFGQSLGVSGSVSTALLFILAGTVNTIVISLILTWLANGTHASIILAMAFHAANNASIRLDSLDGTGIFVNYAVTAVVAIIIVLLNRNMFFAKD